MPTRMAGRAAKLWPKAAPFRRGQGDIEPLRFRVSFHRAIRQGEHWFPLTENLHASLAKNTVEGIAAGQKPNRAKQPTAPRDIPPRHPSSPMARR